MIESPIDVGNNIYIYDSTSYEFVYSKVTSIEFGLGHANPNFKGVVNSMSIFELANLKYSILIRNDIGNYAFCGTDFISKDAPKSEKRKYLEKETFSTLKDEMINAIECFKKKDQELYNVYSLDLGEKVYTLSKKDAKFSNTPISIEAALNQIALSSTLHSGFLVGFRREIPIGSTEIVNKAIIAVHQENRFELKEVDANQVYASRDDANNILRSWLNTAKESLNEIFQ